MSEPTAEPTTLEFAIAATQHVAPLERHQFIRETITRLWTVGFSQWYRYLVNMGDTIHKASGGRLMYNLILDGFADGGTVGVIGLALYAEDRPLCKYVPGLMGDFAGGLENSGKVFVTVGEIGPGRTLSKVPAAGLDPIASLTVGDLKRYAERMVALLDGGAAPDGGWRGPESNVIN